MSYDDYRGFEAPKHTAFTDDDWKRLNSAIRTAKVLRSSNLHGEVEINIATMEFILARMEAAERKCRAYEAHHDADNDGLCFTNCPPCKEMVEANKSWLKTKGGI